VGAPVEVVEVEEVFSTTPDCITLFVESRSDLSDCNMNNNGIKSCLGLLSDESRLPNIEICIMESANIHTP
jgi:hypothetical protein